MADDIARLGYEIDSSQTKQAAKDLDAMAAASGRAAGGADVLKKASNGISASTNGAAMSARQLAQAQRDVAKHFTNTATNAKTMNAAMRQTQTATAALGGSMKTSAAHSTNLLFQFQDIGMMLASGQNPLMLAMQQGTQVAGVFHQMKASGQSAFSGIKAGLMGLVSPTSLLTVGIIAGGAALAQWGISAITAGEDADELSKRMDEVRENTKSLNDELRRMSLGVSEEELVIIESINKNKEEIRDIEEFIALANGDQKKLELDIVKAAIRNLNTKKQETEELRVQLKNLRHQQVAKDRLIKSTRELSDQEREIWTTTQNVSKEAERLVSEIGMAATKSLILAGVDITSPISSATKEAAQLAVNLGIAVDEAISLNNARRNLDESITGGRGGDPRKFGDPFGRNPNEPTAGMSSGALDLIRSSVSSDGRSSGGGVASQRARDLESFIQSLQTERETLEAWRSEQLELLAQFNDAELQAIGGQNEARLRLEREYQERLEEIQGNSRERQLSDTASLFGSLADIASAGGEKSAKAVAAFQAIEGTINAYGAAIKALNTPGLTLAGRFAAYASVLAAGLKGVAAIKQAGNVGGGGGGSSAPSGASAAPQQEPERVVRIEVLGDPWIKGMIEPIIKQLYEATEDGSRVVIAR